MAAILRSNFYYGRFGIHHIANATVFDLRTKHTLLQKLCHPDKVTALTANRRHLAKLFDAAGDFLRDVNASLASHQVGRPVGEEWSMHRVTSCSFASSRTRWLSSR